MTAYHSLYQSSIQNPESFWRQRAEHLDWYRFPTQILAKDNQGQTRWFADGELNTCHLALDYQVQQGRGQQVALYYDSPVTQTQSQITYEQLLQRTRKVAGMLTAQGVTKGDRVVIYMPMIPEAAIAMLACARIGAIHSVVFGGFAPHELAIRIDDAEPKVILTATHGMECDRVIPYLPMVKEALLEATHTPTATIVYQRAGGDANLANDTDITSDRYLDWQTLEQEATGVDCVPLLATDPLYILYTSGTTGKPKGVVRDNGGHAVALHTSLEMLYGMKPGEVFLAASDVGWVVGHAYIVYGPLIYGLSAVLYEGKPVNTPDAGAFWRLCEQYQVAALFAAPTAFRAIRKEDPDALLLQKHRPANLRAVFMAGERLDPATLEWTQQHVQVPVIDHWWQTETGWAIAGNPFGVELMPIKAGSTALPMPGYQVDILDENGQPVAVNQQGYIALKLPLPPGTLPTIWRNHDRFKESYLSRFPGYYSSGDGGFLDEDGYLHVMGRIDDVINVAGHRLSTGEMEEILGQHPDVAECAVVGIDDDIKGQLPLGFVVLKNGQHSDDLESELVQRVRHEIGAIACFRQVVIVEKLPKTRSGKILRRILKAITQGEEYLVPPTIDDASSLPLVEQAVAARQQQRSL